jgi:hypothetical protein
LSEHIRPSQFVITYGPGAILETQNGPRIIPQPDVGLFRVDNQLSPASYEISDQRVSEGLLSGARIFRLPSNAELRLLHDQALYRTRPFPNWRLCLSTRNHANFSVLHHGSNCPVCAASDQEFHEPIRFIAACIDGHIDDIDWYHLVHSRASNQNCQHTQWFRWYGGGGALSAVDVECPSASCNSRVNLGWAYGEDWPCSGRFPEREPLASAPIPLGCRRRSRIMQRQASNLRIPELKTLFTIPPRNTDLHRMLQRTPIYSALSSLVAPGSQISTSFSPQQLTNILNNLASRNLIAQREAAEIMSFPWQEIQQAIEDVLTPVSTTYRELLVEEFEALATGSVHGIPSSLRNRPTSRPTLEIDPNLVRRFPAPGGQVLRVVPVQSLSTVTVQIGYRREVPRENASVNPADLVRIGFNDRNRPDLRWYPGVEFLGEGIFLMMDAQDGWGLS